MGCVHALIMLMVSVAGAEGEQTKDAEVGMIDAANRTVKLIGAGYARTRSRNMGAKFLEVEPNPGTEINVGFSGRALSGAKTTVQTNHVRTIDNIISWSVNWRTERWDRFPEIDWREPQFEVIFSIPKDAQGRVLDFDRWYLISIKPSKAKKEPPKDAVKAMPGAGEGPIFAGHRGVRLVGVRFNDGRQHDLLAKFAGVGPDHGKEIELGLEASIQSTDDHTTVDVTHTRTILNIIKSSVSRTPLPNARFDVTQWREPLFEVIFSIPKDAQGKVSDFSDWSLVSIKMPQAKKKQPKPSDK